MLRPQADRVPRHLRVLEERPGGDARRRWPLCRAEREARLDAAGGPGTGRHVRRRSTGWPSRRAGTACSSARTSQTVDVFTGGRKLRVSVSPSVDGKGLRKGQRSCSTRR